MFVEGADFALVYDAGSSDDLATGSANRFAAYLHAVRPDLRKVDHLVVSHPHRDDVELLAAVVAAYEVTNVWNLGAVNPICDHIEVVAVQKG